MQAHAITDGNTVLAEVEVPAAPERAFAALNSAEVEAWWGAPGLYAMSGWQSDLRVGGRWAVNVVLPDGTELPAGGEYLLLDVPRQVTLTRRYDWDHPTLGRKVTRVRYLFESSTEGTRVAVRQDGFGSRAAAKEHATGWARTLEFLQAYFMNTAGAPPPATRRT